MWKIWITGSLIKSWKPDNLKTEKPDHLMWKLCEFPESWKLESLINCQNLITWKPDCLKMWWKLQSLTTCKFSDVKTNVRKIYDLVVLNLKQPDNLQIRKIWPGDLKKPDKPKSCENLMLNRKLLVLWRRNCRNMSSLEIIGCNESSKVFWKTESSKGPSMLRSQQKCIVIFSLITFTPLEMKYMTPLVSWIKEAVQ